MKKSLITLSVIGLLLLSVATGFAAESSSDSAARSSAWERMYQACHDYGYENRGASDNGYAPGWCHGRYERNE